MSRRELEQRLANTTWSRPPADVPMATCWCGGAYMDTDIGHDSHEVVMGHRPVEREHRSGNADVSRDDEAVLHSGDDTDAASARDPTTDPGQNDPNDSTNEQE